MTEQDQYSSEDLRMTQKIIKDLGTSRTDIPAGFIGEIVGKIEAQLTQRKELVPVLGYSPQQIERASQVTETLLQGIDTDIEFYNADNQLRQALDLQARSEQLIPSPEGLPAISIDRLKQLVHAELGQIKAFEERISTVLPERIEEKALANVAVVNSWVENSHLGEYFHRRNSIYEIYRGNISHRILSFSTIANAVIGIFVGEIGSAGILIFTGGDISIFVAVTVMGGLGGISLGYHNAPGLINLCGNGIYSEGFYLKAKELSRIYDQGDEKGVVRYLANLDRAKLATNLDKFVHKQ